MLCEQHCILLHTALHATGCNVAHVTPYQPSTELSLLSLDPFCYCSVLCVYVKYITKGSVFSQEAIPGSTVPMGRCAQSAAILWVHRFPRAGDRITCRGNTNILSNLCLQKSNDLKPATIKSADQKLISLRILPLLLLNAPCVPLYLVLLILQLEIKDKALINCGKWMLLIHPCFLNSSLVVG